jgi:hypothetical protein
MRLFAFRGFSHVIYGVVRDSFNVLGRFNVIFSSALALTV